MNLSDDERELLNAAAGSESGVIKCVSMNGGVRLGAGGREFIEDVESAGVQRADPRSEARWLHALRGLEDKGLIEPIGHKREMFRVTHEGYRLSDGSSP